MAILPKINKTSTKTTLTPTKLGKAIKPITTTRTLAIRCYKHFYVHTYNMPGWQENNKASYGYNKFVVRVACNIFVQFSDFFFE